MPTAGDAGRHISNLCIRLLLELVEAEVGRAGVDEVVRLAGETRPLSELTEDAAWSSVAQFQNMLRAGAEVLGGVDELAKIGRGSLFGGSMPSNTEMLQALGSPHVLMGEIAEGRNGITTCLDLSGDQISDTEWLLRQRTKPGLETTPEMCAYFRGLHEMTPRLFGYDRVDVVEETCQLRGDECCTFRVRWYEIDEDARQRAALEAKVELLERHIGVFQATVAELVLADDIDTALQRVLTAAARTARAPGHLLCVQLPDAPLRIYFDGMDEPEAERVAAALLRFEPCPEVDRHVVQITSNQRHYGFLAVYDPDGMTIFDDASLEACARLAATALDSASALTEARREAARNRALVELSSALNDIESIDAMARSLARATTTVIGADRAIVAIADWDSLSARFAASYGFDPTTERALATSTLPLVQMTDELIYLGESEVNRPDIDAKRSVANVIVPIQIEGKTEAWLIASVTHDPSRLSPNPELEARLRGLAAQASTAFANARLVEQIRHQALHDALTGLPNRALILDRGEQLIARARREHTPASALFIDLDGFKEINDTLGHAAGDQLLRHVATRLSSAIRDTDTLARIGGDEFVVLVDGSNLDAGPELVAERLLDVLREPFVLEGREKTPLTVTASIGIATCSDRSTAGDLLRDADVALYRAKAAGKNCSIVFAPEMGTAVRERMAMEMHLRSALDNGELFLLYQPMFDLRTGHVNGVEALLRWRHAEHGVVMPDRFIPLLEDTGLIVPVGTWVLHEACGQAARWHDAGRSVDISVNVSARQLDSDRLVDDVRCALDVSGIEPSRLILEVTETTIMRDTEDTVSRLRALKDIGVRIAIDDFGTGYSSLAYLRQFPVDTLKIDRSFINAIADSSEAGALIHTLVSLGKALGLATLAEGIEDADQLQRLRREQCDTGQGFFYAEPLSASELDAFLALRDERLTEVSPI